MRIRATPIGHLETRKPKYINGDNLWRRVGKSDISVMRATCTDVCLNCPARPEACDEDAKAPADWRKQRGKGRPEPECLINVAHFYGISLPEANTIALQTIAQGMTGYAYRNLCKQKAERRELG